MNYIISGVEKVICDGARVTKGECQTLLTLLNPVAPHMTEELWESAGFAGRVYESTWPEYDKAKTIEDIVEIAVQINGKTKATVKIAQDISKEDALSAGKEALDNKLNCTIVK